MRRALLTVLSLVWLATVLACTGIGGPLFHLSGEFRIFRSDHGDYHLFQHNSGVIGGHVEGVAFDDRFILLRRDVSVPLQQPKHRLTGKIEFWVVEVESGKRHGPYTEAEFAAARERLSVPAGLVLEPIDEVWLRQDVGEARRRAGVAWMKRALLLALVVALFFTGKRVLRRLRRACRPRPSAAAGRGL
jgi:hypothetical protein